ncbi:MAG: type II 3-dehydroquinate dehydratase [Alphaproteobacteria bacterium]
MTNILIINGPNLNMLGTREPEVYGSETLSDLESLCKDWAKDNGLSADCMQSNHEGEIVDAIQNADKECGAIIINAGAYTHTSVAIRDAISSIKTDVYEVHISNIHAREEFRHNSYISSVAKGVVCGFGLLGYKLAIETIATNLK